MTTITLPRATVEQALEALEYENSWHEILKGKPYASTVDAITAFRAALAQQAEPLNLADPAVRKRLASQWGYVPAAAQAEPVEPVAWWKQHHDGSVELNEARTFIAEDAIATGRRPLVFGDAALAEPVQDQDVEDAIEAAYWQFDCRKKGLNEWASAPQSERDAFKAEARKLVRGYFPTRQAQDTKREMLAVADAFIRGKRAALAQQAEPTVKESLQVPHEVVATLTTTDIAWLETRRLTKLWQELGQMRWSGADEGWDRALEAVRNRLDKECQYVLDWKTKADQSHATAIELLQKMQGLKDE